MSKLWGSLQNNTLCEIYINQKQWDKAETSLLQADDTISYLGKSIYLKKMIQIERGKGNYRKASDYAERYAVCVDSMYLEKLENNAAMYQKKYDKTKVELEKAELEVDNKQLETTILLIVIIVCIIAIFTVGLIYRRRTIAANRERAKDEAMDNLTQDLQRKIIELQNVRLQLTESKSDANCNRQELEETQRHSQELKEQIFEMNSVVQKISEIKKAKTADLQGKKHILSNEELAILSEAIDSCYNGVITKLKDEFPTMTKEEVNMCCLICLNVPTTKMALLLGLSEDSLRQRKSRLRRTKMHLQDNTTIDDLLESLKKP